MASALKPAELQSYRELLERLRDRIHGDVSQMTDETLGNTADNAGNLSKVPTHQADEGTDVFDQEFDLSMIENDQETLHQIEEALDRVDAGTYGACLECGKPVAKPRLQALPYTRTCIECARALESRG